VLTWLQNRKDLKKGKGKDPIKDEKERFLAKLTLPQLFLIIVLSLIFSIVFKELTTEFLKGPDKRETEAILKALRNGHPT
jgi:Na+/H+ antiporter NhaD/arsenite permease-like protein